MADVQKDISEVSPKVLLTVGVVLSTQHNCAHAQTDAPCACAVHIHSYTPCFQQSNLNSSLFVLLFLIELL